MSEHRFLLLKKYLYIGLDLRCTGQERNRAMEVIAVASGGGRMEILEELWKRWGLSAALDAHVCTRVHIEVHTYLILFTY